MTEPEQEPFRRLVAAASRVCRLADHPDVFDEYNDSDELRAFRRALADLDALLREVDPVPLPPAEQPVPTVADLLAVLLALPDAPGVEELAGQLSDEQVEEVLGVALTLPDRDRQADLIVAVAPYLSAGQAERALAPVPAMDRASQQARTLTALLPRLAQTRRPAAARFAIAAARRVHPAVGISTLVALAPWLDTGQRAELYGIVSRALGDAPGSELCWLAEHYLPEQRADALATVVAVEDENLRALLLAQLAPHLDEAQLRVATDEAGRIADPGFRARALAGVAIALSGEQRREAVTGALAAAREPAGNRHSYLSWSDLLPLLEPDQLDDALTAVTGVRDEHSRAHALGQLSPLLTPAQLPAATAAAEAILNPGARATALAALVPRLPDDLRGPAVAAAVTALTACPGGGWSRQLRALAPQLTAGQLAELWEVALREEREYPQEGLSTLAAYVDAERRERALELALSYEPEHRAETLSELAPHLDAAQRRRVYRAAREIEEPATRARALAGLAAYLSPAEAAEAAEAALTTAATLRDPAARAALLAELAPRLDGPPHGTALAWAFDAAIAIEPEDRGRGFHALTRLIPLIAGEWEPA